MRPSSFGRAGCLLAAALAWLGGPPAVALPVFPGAVGFGSTTVAGRGGAVLRVTNLNDEGPGSLRAALTASGPRVVIFEVSGIIDLKTTLYVGNPYLTVAGQTAPHPGIMVKGSPIVPYGHDMLVQHVASRPGSTFPPGEVINNRRAFCVSSDPNSECYNIVFDHVSGSWSTDEILCTWADDNGLVRDVTISNSIFAEALNNAGHTDEETGAPEAHSMGVMIGRNTRRASVIRNVMAYNRGRNPLCRDNYTDVQVLNNLVYLSDRYDRISIASDGRANPPVTASVCGNVYFTDKDAESVRRPYAVIAHTLPNHVLNLYVRDNWLFNPNTGKGVPYWAPTNGDPWQVVAYGDNQGTVNRLNAEPPQFAALKVPLLGSRASIEKHLLANAGARPADRDPVDARIARQVRGRTGSFIDSPDEVGGYPAWKPITRRLATPANPNGDNDRDGYTNLEERLHRHAAAVESATGKRGPVSANRQLRGRRR